MLIHELEAIPEAGATVEIDDKMFIIEQVSDRRIEVVRVILN
jgi:CBS domain containing-hemolysin-like protein